MANLSSFTRENLKVVTQYVWEVFSWMIMPATFGYLAYLSIYRDNAQIGIIQISLAALALFPWLLKLIARYFSEFSVGPKGVSGKVRQGTTDKSNIDPSSQALAPTNGDKFQILLLQAKRVLHTLWKFQVETFKDDDSKRWGFSVGPGAPDYLEFNLGVSELVKEGLAAVDHRGFVFLTNTGLDFCKQYKSEISTSPFFYEKFSS